MLGQTFIPTSTGSGRLSFDITRGLFYIEANFNAYFLIGGISKTINRLHLHAFFKHNVGPLN